MLTEHPERDIRFERHASQRAIVHPSCSVNRMVQKSDLARSSFSTSRLRTAGRAIMEWRTQNHVRSVLISHVIRWRAEPASYVDSRPFLPLTGSATASLSRAVLTDSQHSSSFVGYAHPQLS